MKKIIFLSIISFLMIIVSCEKEDTFNVDQIVQGAVLTTINAEGFVVNIFEPENSDATIEVKFNDFGNNDSMDKVNLYARFKDGSPTEEGVFETIVDEALLTVLTPSDFVTADDGYPHNTFVFNAQEALDALGLTTADIDGGDFIFYRYELVLNDGSVYSFDNVGSAVSGAGHQSPFMYAATVACIPTSPIAGDYIIEMQDSYGDGWQGSAIVVTLDGVETLVALPDHWTTGEGAVGDPQFLSGTVTVTIPDDAETLEWSFVAGDYPSEVTFQITGPNSGIIIGDFGPSPVEGILTLNLCNE